MNIPFGLRALFRRSRLDREMDEELRFHFEEQVRRNLAAGLAPTDAARAARRQFGWADRIREEGREARGWARLDAFLRDVRHALRSLRRSPGFTLIAVASVAAGIGANTAVFSVLNAILLRSLPVPDPHELRLVEWRGVNPTLRNFSDATMSAGRMSRRGPMTAGAFPGPAFLAFRERASGLSSVFGYFALSHATALARGQATTTSALLVSGNFFQGYGGRPLLGRVLTPTDEEAGAPPVAVISHRAWERWFDRDPRVVGAMVVLNNHSFTIVGVLPPDHAGPLVGDPTDVYVSFAAQARLLPDRPVSSASHWWVQVMARVAPGTSEAEAQASLGVLFRQVLADSSSTMEQPDILLSDGSRGPLARREHMARPFLVLLAIVGLVLVIACANLANLLLARGVARQHEMAVRAAMGACRVRLVQQTLTESVLLACGGAALGLLIAAWGRSALATLAPGDMATGALRLDLSTDARVLVFTLVLTLLTALLAGIVPALQAGRADPLNGLKSRSALGAPRLRFGRVLITAQLALSVLLVVAAGLTVRTFRHIAGLDAGFDTRNLLVFQLNPAQIGYQGEGRVAFFEEARRQISLLPGVSSVAMSDMTLLTRSMSCTQVSIPGRTILPGELLQPHQLVVSDSFFATMGIPLLLGRDFAASDAAGAAPVVVVNERFVREYFGGGSPIGRTVRIDAIDHQIIGVSRDAHYQSFEEDIPPTIYRPHRQVRPGSLWFEVRTVVPPLSLIPSIAKTLAALDERVPLARPRTQEQVVAESAAFQQLGALLCTGLAVLSVSLCCVGIYGLMAYQVARRSGEIGVRLALGATREEVSRAVLRESLGLAARALLAGLPIALAVASIARASFFGVPPYDPCSFVLAAIVILATSVLAAWVPARRAARVDPLVALRAE